MAGEANTTIETPIPPPPRITGDAEADNLGMIHYLHDFYRVAIKQNGLVSRSEYLAAQDDLVNQVDPAKATAATAQQTANDAKTLASTANNTSTANQTVIQSFGTLEFSGTSATATHTFAEPQEDEQYSVVLTAVSSTGTPDVNAFIIIEQIPTAEEFTVKVNAAPGTGSAVTFNWHLRRITGA